MDVDSCYGLGNNIARTNQPSIEFYLIYHNMMEVANLRPPKIAILQKAHWKNSTLLYPLKSNNLLRNCMVKVIHPFYID